MNALLRTLLVSLLITIVSFIPAKAQQNPGSAANEADITAIRTEFARINALPLRKESFTYDSVDCAEDGLVQYFFDQGKIVKVVESGSIGDGSWTREFYYQSGSLIFSYEKIIGGPAIGPVTQTEFRLYVKNGRMLRYMEDRQIKQPDAERLATITTGAALLKAYTTKNFSAVLCK